ncbi:MAG TPA: hypothetical protein VLF71_01070 [Candidatus Saccharimonadales bacterium]|nr:hypothetical protein [Candidatus Saccharimonadales bacterium]
MGLLSRLKANFTHGGVKISLQAPSSVAPNQLIPVTVMLTADSPQTITSVKAEVKAKAKEQGMRVGNGGVGVQAGGTMSQTIAQVESREAFTLAAGETKTVTLQLQLAGPANMLGQAGGAMGNVLQGVMQSVAHVNYLYSIHASADVQGIALDPSVSQILQVLSST